MAQEEAKPAEEQKPAAGAAAPAAQKPKKKGLALSGGIVSLIGLAWALSMVAVPAKHEEIRHEIAGPFVANISPATGFQVNLAGRGGKNYLAMSLKAEVDAYAETYATERVADPLYQAKLTDAVLKVAARKTKLDLDTEVGKDVFREELKVALDPVLFPVHVGSETAAATRDVESGLRPGASSDKATLRGLFYEHALEVDATEHTLQLDAGAPVRFKGDETDLMVLDVQGRSLYVDVSGLHPGFRGSVHAGTFGRVRNIYFGSFLTQ
jgi:flagellar basal body-associated protein FliL